MKSKLLIFTLVTALACTMLVGCSDSSSSDSYDDSSSYSSSYDDSSSYSSSKECYVCGDSAYSKYGSYYYRSDCLALVKAFSN